MNTDLEAETLMNPFPFSIRAGDPMETPRVDCVASDDDTSPLAGDTNLNTC
jgi:hypothetical protein